MRVDEVMSRAIFTVTPRDTIRCALRVVDEHQLRHLPVVDGARVVGIVSDRDLREYRLPLLDELARPSYADELLERRVDEAMNPDVICVETGASLRTAVELMLEHRVGAIVVVDGHQRQLAGVVSYIDVLEAVRTSL